MGDLVGTCPKDFWHEWIAEGDPAGTPESGQTWGWYTRHSLIDTIAPVARGRDTEPYALTYDLEAGSALIVRGCVPFA